MRYNISETGDRIRFLREKKRLTQGKLADLLACGLSHVGRCERGVEGFSVEKLMQIADLFGVSVDYLLTGQKLVKLNDSGNFSYKHRYVKNKHIQTIRTASGKDSLTNAVFIYLLDQMHCFPVLGKCI